jgi:predicted RNase H-related nuclease YkuK (DUF458 family)
MIKNKNWFTGVGTNINYEPLIEEIRIHVLSGGSVFIGTDSQLSPSVCTFASVICLHNDVKRKLRIMSEVHSSIEIGLIISEMFPRANVEIHIDIGSGERSRTRGYVDEFSGWVRSLGFKCKIKPDAWASFAVADKHTK